MMELKVDPARERWADETGVVVRAKRGERWGNYDVAHLDKASMLEWLRSRGGKNEWAENFIGQLLEYGRLT